MISHIKNLLFGNLLKTSHCLSRCFHVSPSFMKLDDRRVLKNSAPKRDEGTEGEHLFSLSISKEEMYPTEDLPNKLFNNVPFSLIPICNIKASKNNTILTIADPKSGKVKLIRSCGIEGFKNTRKGTNIAAQATAITFGSTALSKGYNTIRVRVRGLGPGRMSALKGLQMAGVNIISVTDNTPVSWHPPRPRKRRKL